MPIEVESNLYMTPSQTAIAAAMSAALNMSGAASTLADGAMKKQATQPGRTAVGGGGALTGTPSTNPNERFVLASRPSGRNAGVGLTPDNTTQKAGVTLRRDERQQPGTVHSGKVIP